MFCNNNPIMYVDENGNVPKWIKTGLDFLTSLFAYSNAKVAATITFTLTGDPVVSAAAGATTFGAINNTVNGIYYNYISDENSELTSSSYQAGYINRWDRLDYVKSQENMPSTYNKIAIMYYSEYNLHMYGWYLTGWAFGKKIPLISKFAERASDAEITIGELDKRWYVKVGIVILELLGL